MEWWYRLKKSKGWLGLLFALSVVGALFIAAFKLLRPTRVVRETKKIPVPVPDTDHVEEYHAKTEKDADRRADNPRDPTRLSAKIIKLTERRGSRG